MRGVFRGTLPGESVRFGSLAPPFVPLLGILYVDVGLTEPSGCRDTRVRWCGFAEIRHRSPPPPTARCVLLPEKNCELLAITSLADNARSATGKKYVQFEVGGVWTEPMEYFTYASYGQTVKKVFPLEDTPTQVRTCLFLSVIFILETHVMFTNLEKHVVYPLLYA